MTLMEMFIEKIVALSMLLNILVACETESKLQQQQTATTESIVVVQSTSAKLPSERSVDDCPTLMSACAEK